MPPNVEVPEQNTPGAEGFSSAMRDIFGSLDALGGKVLEALAVHLGQKRAYFADKVDEGNSILRVIHYPPVAGGTGDDGKENVDEAAAGAANGGGAGGPGHVRAAAHEDINLITLLLGADEGGLQLRRRDGTWLEARAAHSLISLHNLSRFCH